jgi:hypothetical protein
MILKIENLQLVIEKRTKLVQTRSELDRFQISSNELNSTMRLNDSDGNVFTTSITPGIKKVIGFLKTSFDTSITEAENKITFIFMIVFSLPFEKHHFGSNTAIPNNNCLQALKNIRLACYDKNFIIFVLN